MQEGDFPKAKIEKILIVALNFYFLSEKLNIFIFKVGSGGW